METKKINVEKINSWRVKDNKTGLIKLVPIKQLNNLHLTNATVSSLLNVDKLRKEQEMLENKLAKLKNHIENCSLATLNMFNEVQSRNLVINFPDSKIKQLHPEMQEIFFEESYIKLSKKDLQMHFKKEQENVSIPVLA